MKILSLIVLVLIELLFAIVTVENKNRNKGAFIIGNIVGIMLCIPIIYIFFN